MRTLVFAACLAISSRGLRASIVRTPFCAIPWRSPSGKLTLIISKPFFLGKSTEHLPPIVHENAHTIDTESNAKRNNTISELLSFRITKAKAKVKFGVKYPCKYEREGSSVPNHINTKAKTSKCLLVDTLSCVAAVSVRTPKSITKSSGTAGAQDLRCRQPNTGVPGPQAEHLHKV